MPAFSTEAQSSRIRQLFLIERPPKEQALAPEDVLRCGRARAPLLEEFEAWMVERALTVLAKGPTGDGDRLHATNHGRALTRYLEDGRIPIYNNGAERAFGPSRSAGRTGSSSSALVAGRPPRSS